MKDNLKTLFFSLTRRNFLILLTCAIVLASMVIPAFYLHSQNITRNQGAERVLEKGNDFTPPVNITMIKSRFGEIEAGRKFTADENWFENLSVNIDNNSEKPITYISVSVRFPRSKGENGLDFVVPLSYGENPFPSKDKEFSGKDADPIMPKKSVELNLSEEKYVAAQSRLKELGYQGDIKKIRVYITTIGFDDGTIWMGDKIYKLDKDNSGRLIPLEKKNFKLC